MARHFLTSSCMLLSLVAFAGCGGPTLPTIPVTGTVTVDGTAMEGVSVVFSPSAGGKAASGTTDAQGNFKLTTQVAGDGALAGDYKIAISKAEVADDGLPESVDPNDDTAMDDFYGELDTSKENEAKSLIGEKWGKASTSGLTATVAEGGDNNFTFEVTSK